MGHRRTADWTGHHPHLRGAINGRGKGARRDHIDSLRFLDQHHPAADFDTTSFNNITLHKAAYSEAVDWWASRIDKLLRDLFSPATYLDPGGVYRPEIHQGWMLNIEQLMSRIGAILRHPTDQAAQLMLMFPALDILGDSITATNGAGNLMVPSRIRKRINAIKDRLPARIAPLILAPAHRALAPAEQAADGFFVSSPNPDSTTDSLLQRFWTARRNTTHGFGGNADILAEHSGLLPADTALVPIVYLLDSLTDREGSLSGSAVPAAASCPTEGRCPDRVPEPAAVLTPFVGQVNTLGMAYKRPHRRTT